MDHSYLKKLIDWAARAPISEIEVVDGDIRIHLVKKAGPGSPGKGPHGVEAAAPSVEAVVSAPLPGVFYLQASPESAPFVAVGQRIGAGDTIGLIEAMKMFNPVISDLDGIVDEVLADSGQEVSVGQPLLRLRRAEGGQP